MARALAKVMPGSKQKHVSPAPPAADVGENVWDEMLALAAAEAASKELVFFIAARVSFRKRFCQASLGV